MSDWLTNGLNDCQTDRNNDGQTNWLTDKRTVLRHWCSKQTTLFLMHWHSGLRRNFTMVDACLCQSAGCLTTKFKPRKFPHQKPCNLSTHSSILTRSASHKMQNKKELTFSACSLMRIMLLFNTRNFNALLFVLCRERPVSGSDKLWQLHATHL
jgi:hypothetical protein